jgi:hypothetical protein
LNAALRRLGADGPGAAPADRRGGGIWVAEGELPVLGGRCPLRMTAIDLGGATWLHSPIPLRDELRAELDATLPPVRFIVAPNRWHHLYAGVWAAAYPQAQLYGAPGLREKRPTLPLREELGDQAPAAWAEQLDQLVFRAMPIFNEVIFFHRASRSLIVTDLVFHMHDLRWDLFGLYVRAAGSHGRFGPSRVSRRFIRDRALARQLLDRILAWPFERVILSHGEIVEKNGRDALRAAFAWL